MSPTAFVLAGTVPAGVAPLSVEDLTYNFGVDQDGCGLIGGILRYAIEQ